MFLLFTSSSALENSQLVNSLFMHSETNSGWVLVDSVSSKLSKFGKIYSDHFFLPVNYRFIWEIVWKYESVYSFMYYWYLCF